MNKTPKAYRDDLSKDLLAKRKDANDKIKRIQDNPDFLESHKAEAIKVVKDTLYKSLDDARATEEYKDAKSKKQALRSKKEGVKKQEEIVAEQKKLLEDKEAELAKMSEEYGEKFEKKSEKKESKETSTNLPSDVASQETKAIAYFEKNNEINHLKVVDYVKKLREDGKITYEDLGWGKYNVIMSCGSKKLKMYFPADTKLSDISYDYTNFDGEVITKKETTRRKLWSKEWKKYVEQKEKEWQKLLSESEFKTLIQSLYPGWTEQEQILAFMMATWFYGRMRLSDKTWDFQRAVRCYRESDFRNFYNMDNDDNKCSLVHSTFIG